VAKALILHGVQVVLLDLVYGLCILYITRQHLPSSSSQHTYLQNIQIHLDDFDLFISSFGAAETAFERRGDGGAAEETLGLWAATAEGRVGGVSLRPM